MSAIVYLLGLLLVIAGAAYGAMLLGVPQLWIIVGAVILGGLGIMAAAGYLRRRDVVHTTTPAPYATGQPVTVNAS